MFLVLLCIIMLSRTNHLQGNAVLNSANSLAGKVYNQQRKVSSYFRLREMNDSLLHENEKLRNALMEVRSFDTFTTFQQSLEISSNSDTSKEVIKKHNFIFRNARVINNSVSTETNYITINRGSQHGVQINMPVISGNGVVGKVVRTSANYAVVLSVLSTIQPVSSRLKDGTTGLVKWEGRKPFELLMYNIPAEIPVKIGDTVVTTEFSFFPEGIPVGEVIQVMISKKTRMKVLYLKPFTNFRKLQYVYVLEDKAMAERSALEDSVKLLP